MKLAQDFDIQTVAEGVENAETIDLLHRLGVDYAQGFHISRPAPLEIRASIDQRDADLSRGQTHRDAHQAQLDNNQDGLELRQRVLDDESDALDGLDRPAPPVMNAQLLEAAQGRVEAANQRAHAAVARADDAGRRAQAAVRRSEALELRVNAGDDELTCPR